MVSTPSGSDPIDPAPSGPEAAAPAALKRRRVIAAVLSLVLVAVVVVSALVFTRPAADVAAPAPIIADSATPTPTPSETPPPAPALPPPPEPIAELPAAPMNILVIGSDSRANAREQAAITQATGESQDHRADTLMLVHVPADRRSVHVVSLMRDLYVNIPEYGFAKINESLQAGGIPLATRTVESLMGTHIDHTVMLDFNGFKTLTDGLGGIDVNVTVPFQSTHETQHVFTAGVNHLDGQAALEFVRERYAFVDGDFQRVRNQQTFLRAILARLTSDGALHDVTAVRALVSFAAGYLTVDQGFDPVGVAILAYGMRGIDPNAVVSLTLPTAGVGTAPGGASVVFPDYGGIAQVAAAMREGRLPEYAGG
ncbi:LCP family protein [Pseudarthrobacter sp. AL07]|uniref:LCP family protein n=1 Tax=unclassified Pseudarthrobacter TaxID=2647000 RepID=UPI00249CEF16|nr:MULTISPECIES: LCP family protein [unclassified Pseudarthrobacter]MDI3194299.1 LCP family protein [Pseudarthrobacter sp. AL20]MDI3208366.1 LCP family protein [Pseudarthrobacter sp. AL07]